MTAFPSLAIANAVLDEANGQGKHLTIMQLLKLVYIAHGWSLALFDSPLVNEEPEAWQHGPVFPSIYREFRRFGAQPILTRATAGQAWLEKRRLSEQQCYVIRFVVENYGNMHAFALSRLTHEADTPWSLVYLDGRGISGDIPDSMTAIHYKKLAQERRYHS